MINPYSAFHNDETIKTDIIKQLRDFPNEKRISGLNQWDELHSSFSGVIAQSDKSEDFIAKSGLPAWLAIVLDACVINGECFEDPWNETIKLLENIEIGTDISLIAHDIISCCLDGGIYSIFHTATSEEVKTIAREMAQIHVLAAKGKNIEMSYWRQKRKSAIKIADKYDEFDINGICSQCVEAAGWDAVKSRTAVWETLNLWQRAMTAKYGYPWTLQDDQRVRSRLDEIHAEEKAKLPEGTYIDVFKILEVQSPEIAKEINDRYKINSEIAKKFQEIRYKFIKLCLQGQNRLIPRHEIFSNPDRAGLQISRDGNYFAWLQNKDGIMNIWAAPADDINSAKQISFDKKRGIGGFFWSYQSNILLFSQDSDGDENWRIYSADVKNGEIKSLTHNDTNNNSNAIRASISHLSRKHPSEIVISMNNRDPSYPDLYLLNILNCELSLLKQNDGFAGFLLDEDYKIRIATRPTQDGGAEIYKIDGENISLWIKLNIEDVNSTGPAWFSVDGETLYFYDSRGRDKTALTSFNMKTGQQTLIAESELADIGGVIEDTINYEPLAYSVTYKRHNRYLLSDKIKADIEFLDNAKIGEWSINSRTSDDKKWIISAGSDINPAAVYIYKRDNKVLEKLYELRPNLKKYNLSQMHDVIIKSHDGLDMVSYITLPQSVDLNDNAASLKPVPMVLMVHGGPWARDYFGYNAMHQWLSNRGYAVLSVNFRASSGFGKSFLRAGDGEWGGKMDLDLIDAANWAIEKGIAQADKIAIYGGSYGGYAVLSGLSNYPDFYSCGIDIVGPSNLETLLASIPKYWEAARQVQYRAIGNPETEDGRNFLYSRSPLHKASNIIKPLLIAQGGNDPRVKQAESEQMVKALRSHKIAVSYALFKDEGHGFAREANRMIFNAITEKFLAENLGGQYEEYNSIDFKGNSLQFDNAI